jgi:uncharacterized membrane protein YdjX (TVP38/TMEM64 family)
VAVKTTANPFVWLRAVVLLGAIGGLLLAIRHSTMIGASTPQDFADWLSPHRHAWYALPVVVFAFVALGLAFVPVLLLITATGVAFGPVLGPMYAMAGCLASASTGFAIGRWTGLQRVERFGGDRAARIARTLGRNGVLAVFLLRKIPAPFLLSNIIAGASRVRYRDFVIGTVLGMGVIVVALAGFGSQLGRMIVSPTPAAVVAAIAFAAIPLTFAWFINRALRPAADES